MSYYRGICAVCASLIKPRVNVAYSLEKQPRPNNETIWLHLYADEIGANFNHDAVFMDGSLHMVGDEE